MSVTGMNEQVVLVDWVFSFRTVRLDPAVVADLKPSWVGAPLLCAFKKCSRAEDSEGREPGGRLFFNLS